MIRSKSSDTSMKFFWDKIIRNETNSSDMNECGNKIFINLITLVFSTFWLRYLNSCVNALREWRKTKYNVKLIIIGNK